MQSSTHRLTVRPEEDQRGYWSIALDTSPQMIVFNRLLRTIRTGHVVDTYVFGEDFTSPAQEAQYPDPQIGGVITFWGSFTM
jgi:hypothetical protein